MAYAKGGTKDSEGSMKKRGARGGLDGTQCYLKNGQTNATGMRQPGWTAEQIQRGYKSQPSRPATPMINKGGK